MGDELHAILNCPNFNDIRNRVFLKINNMVPQFNSLNDKDKLVYMLSCESDCALLVGKLFSVILSTQRPNFNKLWNQLHNPNGGMIQRAP